ncbi:MAG TPA: hypothetical protein VGF96_19220 [Terracidiphilus sp.]|jgi:DNA-binding response OmpR family regulator
MRLLILEDNPKDVALAKETAHAEGFGDIEAFASLTPAIESIEQGLQGEKPLPDAFLVDLDLGSDSGYEFLRFWYRRRATSKVGVIVWSQLEERN